MGTTYDTGALLAAEANRRELWALHARCLLRGCRIEDLDEQRARAAGVACGRSGTRDVVDASVVVGALSRGDLVITSDPDDLQSVAGALARSIRIHPI